MEDLGIPVGDLSDRGSLATSHCGISGCTHTSPLRHVPQQLDFGGGQDSPVRNASKGSAADLECHVKVISANKYHFNLQERMHGG